MNHSYSFAVLFAGLLSGCITPAAIPETVVDVAKQHNSQTESDIIDTHQSYAHISTLLKNKSGECLRKQVSSEMYAGTSGGQQHYLTQIVAFTPNVTVSNQKTRLTLQSKIISGSTEIGMSPPPDGWYYLVVDVYPAGKNNSRVEMYYQKTASSYHVTYDAVKSWVTGKSLSCPDFSNSTN